MHNLSDLVSTLGQNNGEIESNIKMSTTERNSQSPIKKRCPYW